MASANQLAYDRHPKLFELKEKGCSDGEMAAMTIQVYLELTKVRKWCQVEVCFNKELNVAYVTGHQPNGQEESPALSFKVVIPVRVQRKLSFDDLMTFQRVCPQSNGSVILCFVDQDSTVVYYEIEEGIKNLGNTNRASSSSKVESNETESKVKTN